MKANPAMTVSFQQRDGEVSIAQRVIDGDGVDADAVATLVSGAAR